MNLFEHPYRGATTAEEVEREQEFYAHCFSVIPDKALDYYDMMLQEYGDFDNPYLRWAWIYKEKRREQLKIG